jgi:hypothetical protein
MIGSWVSMSGTLGFLLGAAVGFILRDGRGGRARVPFKRDS